MAKPDEKPCGCRAVPTLVGEDTHYLAYCPLHQAAGQMAEALEDLAERAERARSILARGPAGNWGMLDTKRARAALAAAGRGK